MFQPPKELISRIRNNKTLINGGLFSLFSFFNRGIGFILLMILAKYILPAEYGQLNLFFTIVTFLGYFVGLSTAGYLSIAYFHGDKKDFKKDFTAICFITVCVSTFLGILMLYLHSYLSVCLKFEPIFLYIALTISFCSIFVQMNLDYLRVQEKVSQYGLLSCTFAICNMVFSLYFVIDLGQSWMGYVYSHLACNAIYFVISVIWFYKEQLFTYSKDIARYKRIIYWGIPLIPHQASIWIRQGCDRYIIESCHALADVGLFSFALNLTNIIIMVGMAFNNTNSVGLYKTLSSDMSCYDKIKRLRSQERKILYVYIAATIFITVSGISLVPLVLPKYTDALPYFSILAIYGFLQCIYFLYCNYLFYFKKTKKLMYITFGSSVLHLCLSLVLTRYGLIFTSMIYIISFLTVAIMVKINSKILINKILTNK